MKMEWNKMTPAEKKWFVPICIYVAIALVFVVLDLSGTWKNQIFTYMTVLFFFVEGVVTWKSQRKMALLSFVIAIVSLFNIFGA